jgi:hypothetical protein
MKASFANAIYPATPQGATLRVRINTISIASTPPELDGEHDGDLFTNTDVRVMDCDYFEPTKDIDWGQIHKLSYQVRVNLLSLQELPGEAGLSLCHTAL